MRVQRETPWEAIEEILTGHFHENAAYANWRRYGTPDWLIVLTVGGGGRFGHAEGEIITKPGDVVLIRPRTLHDYGTARGSSNWELLWAHFHPRPNWIEWLDWPTAAPGLSMIQLKDRAVRHKIMRRLEECNRLANSPWRRRQSLAMNALEEVLLWCDLENPKSQQAKLDTRIREAMDFICRNVAEKITIDAIAEAAGLSASRLSHLFKQQVGKTPQQFLEKQRMDRAVQLLEMTPLSVKEIARQVGFENPLYFTLRFTKQFGRSPRAHRSVR